jgi:hypothetical protein
MMMHAGLGTVTEPFTVDVGGYTFNPSSTQIMPQDSLLTQGPTDLSAALPVTLPQADLNLLNSPVTNAPLVTVPAADNSWIVLVGLSALLIALFMPQGRH